LKLRSDKGRRSQKARRALA